MHTATRGPGRRKQHYSQATFNMHMEVRSSNKHKLFVVCYLSNVCCTLLLVRLKSMSRVRGKLVKSVIRQIFSIIEKVFV